MADRVRIKNTGDAYVDSQQPRRNFSNTQRMYVKANYPGNCRGYLFFGRPFPPGATITKANLRLVNGTTLNNGADLLIARIAEPWKRNKITWENRPLVNGGEIRVSKEGQNIPAETEWICNVTTLLQQVADGAPWFGLHFTCNDGRGDWFYGSAARNANLRPYLELEWTEKAEVPTNLSPSNGNLIVPAKPVLRFDWTNDRGGSAIQSVRVRLAKNAAMTTSVWDLGWVDTDSPVLDTSATSFPGMAEGETWFWDVQVRDASGAESPRSDVVSFGRKAQGIVTIVNPGNGSPNFVEETSPPVIWTFSLAQSAYQVIVYDPSDSNEILADSGKVSSTTATAWTIPVSARLRDGKTYGVEVRIWGTERRERNGGVPAYSFAQKQFQVIYTAATSPVTALTVTQIQPFAWAQLSWSRSTAPDAFEIYMGQRMVQRINNAGEALIAGSSTNYRVTIRVAPPRKGVTWRVVPIVNGKGALGGPTVTTEFSLLGPILCELDGSNPVILLNPAKDEARSGQQTVHEVVGNYPPVLITQSQGGRDGTLSGVLAGSAIPGVPVETEKARIDQLRKGEGRRLMLSLLDDSFECFIANTEVQARVDGEGIFYEVSFEFYQTDFA